ncbi:Uncharacterized conserved protein [Pseudobutyrivibrio sp. YE44]|uniref:nuclease-related domain-containing DEAD/DEAH box helicase n=1 Tax=Pseudobutyrivibrio sp. YE44 TaxID=1520802 RepID=UPI00088365EA|nr:NERD domain-containing protein [Pseudobutyrivibrio sp. YE44]SDB07118.1 Uncharacterized conserved protein [Pseudobutyrivibrio sp. YE44]
MAIMHPDNIAIYDVIDSEKQVYYALKTQLPDSDYEVFYSVTWQRKKNGKIEKSEADFIITSPKYGFLCLEVKGGTGIEIDDNSIWHISDNTGGRELSESPYEQAEKSMYYFKDIYANANHLKYPGIFAAGAIFPFYNLSDDIISKISDRNRECTIMFSDMNSLEEKIKKMFKLWGGNSYGYKLYTKQHHEALLDLIKKKIAISAAAGALVEVKERELSAINRVQDNYIYLLSNIRQFYIRGGAGTGKTWIAIKLANYEAKKESKTLFLCASKPLSDMVKKHVTSSVDVYDIESLFSEIKNPNYNLVNPLFEGISDNLREDLPIYDAVFIDEAQDFTEEWAYVIKMLLSDEKQSRLGVFYDDVQIIRENSFGDAFMIDLPPLLLNENIRNTSNIYKWASETTNLGKDVITNPIEGPIPVKEKISDKRHLSQRLENLFKEYLYDEALKTSSLVILVDYIDDFFEYFDDGIAKWLFTRDINDDSDKIRVSTPEDFKGLESDMIIYIHSEETTDNIDYIAYTRAKYYLLELIMK